MFPRYWIELPIIKQEKELLVNTYEDFADTYNLNNLKEISFDYFKDNFYKNDTRDRILYKDYLEKNTFGDFRDNNEEWMRNIYEFFYEDRERFLKLWWKNHCYISPSADVLSDMFYYLKDVKDIDGVIQGKKYAKNGRIIKNLFFDEIFHSTQKSTGNSPTTLTVIFDFCLRLESTGGGTLSPYTFDIIKEKRYEDYFAILRGTTSKASVFNPYTYSYILQHVLPRGKKLFCPVSSWCVPVLAFNNLPTYDHLVVCDVIPNVIKKSKELNKVINDRATLFEREKKLDAYCCPSEELDKTHDFSNKYKDYFDTVFFSPPYYNVELYPDINENQSTTKYKTYEEWLVGYWEETVKLCSKVLKKDATFSFVIVENYKDGNIRRNISGDMLDITKKYFSFDRTEKLSWGGFDIKGQNQDKRKNVVEDIHILIKK